MLLRFARFEMRYWLRGMMLWVFLVIIAAMIWGAASSDQVRVGGSVGNTNRNAPFVIQSFYATVSILTLLMTVAFVNAAAARDFACNTAQMLFSKPLRKRDFLLGRFLGSALIAMIPMLGVSIGVLLAPLAPWADQDRFGAIYWAAHWKSLLVFAVPNTLFVAAIIFTVAALTRSTITSFLSGLILLVAYIVSSTLLSDIKHEWIAGLLDPFAARTFAVATKYWTPAERNTLSLGLEGALLWNRLLWLGVGAAVLACGLRAFRFEERSRKARGTEDAAEAAAPPRPAAVPPPAAPSRLAQFRGVLRRECLGVLTSTSFIVIAAAGLLNTVPSLIYNANEGYGNHSLPVTYAMLDLIQGSLYLFLIAILTYYAGVLVWRERDARMDEIHDALPSPDWIGYTSKFLALMLVVAALELLALGAAVAVQAWQGYTRFQLPVYFASLFGFDFSYWILLAVMAFLIHVLSPNKYIGYFLFIAYLIVDSFIWRPLDVASSLPSYATRPSTTYSDFFAWAPYLPGWAWFTAYWSACAVLLSVATLLFWPRGKETALSLRLRVARAGFRGAARVTAVAALAAFALLGGWIYYNTLVLNRLETRKTGLRRQADYEKTYKAFAALPQPRVQRASHVIEVYPQTRNAVMRSEQLIRNTHAQPIPEIHITMNDRFEQVVEIPGTRLVKDDRRLQYRIYRADPPMAPGEERRMLVTLNTAQRGFENEVSSPQFVQNGTFFNNFILPQIGYQSRVEIDDKNDRKEFGLPEKDRMPALERNCAAHCMNTYLSNNSDWAEVDTVISTGEDQMAVAPGTLEKEWRDKGRRYFKYRLDRASMNFYSFISARYIVAREKWNGVDVEVYYHGEHKWNVDKMLKSIAKSLDYFTANFGPYAHKQARIIEFPRVARFAQAFPGSMPYSESIGFIANLEKPDAIDFVYFVVAHEMAHQWWAHQVIGANMQGATLLSESLAEYSALMVMEREYGADQIHKFLEYEADRYLRGRGAERIKEQPLLTVESTQGYIHYQKGALALYYLKEMIGEEAVNSALRKLVDKWAYRPPPYPTSHELVDLLRAETPPELQYLIKDLFEDITLFANRTHSASARRRSGGGYDVTIEVEAAKLKADGQGNETPAPMNDFVEIGAYAKAEKGKKYGRMLHRERVRMQTGRHTFTFTVNEAPEKAGIDPRHLLIDRVPDDNLKKVDLP